MGLFDAFKGIVKAIPVVGDLVEAISPPTYRDRETGIEYTSEGNPLGGFFKKAGKGLAKSLADREEEDRRPTTSITSPPLGGTRGVSFQNLPGYSNPYFKNLYNTYDITKLMQRNLITSKQEVIRVPSPGAPSGPTLKLTRKKDLDD